MMVVGVVVVVGRWVVVVVVMVVVVVVVMASQRSPVLLPPADHVPVSDYVSLVVESVVSVGFGVAGAGSLPPGVLYFVSLVHAALHGGVSVVTLNIDVVSPHSLITTGPPCPKSLYPLTPDVGGPPVGCRLLPVHVHSGSIRVHSLRSSITPL